LRGRQADAHQRLVRDRLQALERQREMRPAPRADDRVNLVDDHRRRRPQHLAAAFGRQQQIERLRRRHDEVRRRAQHRRAFALGRVASADGCGDPGWLEPRGLGEGSNPAPRLGKVLMDVGAERLQRRDVDDADFIRQRRPQAFLKQIVEGGEKRRQGLARPGRGRDQRMPAGANGRPSAELRLGRRAKRICKPLSNERMK
jgi:hypothetical protein